MGKVKVNLKKKGENVYINFSILREMQQMGLTIKSRIMTEVLSTLILLSYRLECLD